MAHAFEPAYTEVTLSGIFMFKDLNSSNVIY